MRPEGKTEGAAWVREEFSSKSLKKSNGTSVLKMFVEKLQGGGG